MTRRPLVVTLLVAGLTLALLGLAEGAAPVPRPGAPNPEVTQATIRETICRRGWTATVRPPAEWSQAVKRRLIQEQHWNGPAILDHRLSLSLGGTSSLENSQLQTPADAARKDADERRLHAEACAGRMTLEQAQRELLERWPARVQEKSQ